MSKMEATNKASNEAVGLAKLANDALDAVEEKVDNNEASLRAALANTEARMMECMQQTVKGMVMDQLRAAGFDPDLSAGALTMPTASSMSVVSQNNSELSELPRGSYAVAAANTSVKSK